MNEAVATHVIPTAPGTPFAGGFYVGRIRVLDDVCALILAPKFEGERAPGIWNKRSTNLEAAMSFFDGEANTCAMAGTGSELAAWALALSIGGFTDWHIPSRDELELCYRNLKPGTETNYCFRGDNPSSVPVGHSYLRDAPAQCQIEAFRAGGAEAFEEEYYWSSTQYAGLAGCAWAQAFDDGSQDLYLKGLEFRARAVRRLIIR